MIDLKFETSDLANFKIKVDLEEILDEASAFLLSRILSRFMAETGPDGVPWVPSKAGMARRLNGGTGTLFDTGRLYRSIQIHKLKGARRISTDVEYASLMQFGGGEFNLPPRPFLGFSTEDEVMVKQIVQLRISEMLGS